MLQSVNFNPNAIVDLKFWLWHTILNKTITQNLRELSQPHESLYDLSFRGINQEIFGGGGGGGVIKIVKTILVFV
jgi:hypothetical protein